MNNQRDFVKNILNKSRAMDAGLSYGDKLMMFSCVYKVISSQDKGYTILEDERNNKVAFVTDRLKDLMKKGIASSVGPVNLFKAQPSGKPRTPGGEPIGTIHQGAKGSYKKVSMNPPMWVHVTEGTHHSSPDKEKEHPLSHPEDEKAYNAISAKITSHAHPEDHEKLKKLVLDYIESKKKFQALRTASSGTEANKKGEKVGFGVASGTVNRINNIRDEVHKKHMGLLTALKESRAKKLKEGK